MALKALMSDPLVPVTLSSMTLVLAYPVSDTLFAPSTTHQHTPRTHHVISPWGPGPILHLPRRFSPWRATRVTPSHLLWNVFRCHSSGRLSLTTLYKKASPSLTLPRYLASFFTTWHICLPLVSHLWGQTSRTVPGTWQEFCRNSCVHAQWTHVNCLTHRCLIKTIDWGTYVVVQWLRLHVPNAGSLSSIPGQGTRSYMPHLRVHMPQLKGLTRCSWDPVQPDK